MEDIIKNMTVLSGYEAMGVDAYYTIVEENKKVKKDMKKLEKELGEEEAKYILLVSKLDILVTFLSLKILTKEDRKTLLRELYNISKELYLGDE